MIQKPIKYCMYFVFVAIGMGALIYSNIKLSEQVKEAELATQKCMIGQSFAAKAMKEGLALHQRRLEKCLDERNKAGNIIRVLNENKLKCEQKPCLTEADRLEELRSMVGPDGEPYMPRIRK